MKHAPARPPARLSNAASVSRLALAFLSESYYGDLDVKELAMRALGGGSGTPGRVSKKLEPEVERSSALELSRNTQ